MNRPYQISKEKLVTFSGEHLYYEIVMLYGATRMLQEGVTDMIVYNALLESFVIHASNILDFFYKPASQPDDAKAIHYVRNVKKWNEALPSYAKYFRKFNRKRNKEVTHLTYKRLDVKPHEKKWGSPEITKQIQHIVDCFLTQADPEHLHPNIYELREGRIPG